MAAVFELVRLIDRILPPEPWAEGDNIPWDEPEFSQRMLAEHLSQAHDHASRRAAKIDLQVQWIHQELLGGRRAHVLDLACGPGLYALRLAGLGHTCHGIDFSPASIAYAREQAGAAPCEYVLGDVRHTPYGGPYDLVMMLFGQLNVFRPDEARDIVERAYAALRPGGLLLLEPHTYEGVVSIAGHGGGRRDWSASNRGLFSAQPHLLLTEAFWDGEQNVATERFYVIDAATGRITRSALSTQAYSSEQYMALLEGAGFVGLTFYPSLLGEPDPEQSALLAITARRSA
ncbi:MAG: class I SAM-dependent methyltransferase [Chloroflexi bacterium]|nr:class I SAM-dependent methyltransferase [Chloroflexota bacterium]